MSIEDRPNQTVALVCDRPGCHIEVLGQNEAEAREDANLIGWHSLDGGKQHKCPDCAAGRNPAAVAQFGTDKATLPAAPIAYQQGDAVHAPDGTVAGYAEHACKAGEPLVVVLVAPGQDAPPVRAAGSGSQYHDPDLDDDDDDPGYGVPLGEDGPFTVSERADGFGDPNLDPAPSPDDLPDDSTLAALFDDDDDSGVNLNHNEPDLGTTLAEGAPPRAQADKPASLSQPHGATLADGVVATPETLAAAERDIADKREVDNADTNELFEDVDAMFSTSTWNPDHE